MTHPHPQKLMGRRRCKCIAIGLGIAPLLFAHVLAAQAPDTVLGTRLLAHLVLHAPFRDTLSLELRKHGQYRIAVWPAASEIHIVPQRHPSQPDFAPRVREGSGSRATSFELYVLEDGPHLITASPPAGTTSVIIWLWEDTLAEVAIRGRHERSAGLGLSVEAGSVSGYAIQEPTRAPASRYIEAGALIGSNWFLSLLLGEGNDPRARGLISVNWAFAELRALLLHTTAAGRELSLVGTARVSQGNATITGEDPVALGGGALVTWHFDHRRGTRGLIIGAHASWYRLHNLALKGQTIGRFATSFSWVP